MASQGRTLGLLGGALALGIGAVVWLMLAEDANVEATDAGGAAAVEESASPNEGPEKSAAAKRPRKAGTASVRGEVRRSKGRVPVADQEVELLPERGEPYVVKTGANGAFELTQIPHGGPYELRVAAPGCGTIRMPGIALDRHEKRDVGTLWLDPAVQVTAVVKSWADLPVEGAIVEAYAAPQTDFDWTKAYAQMAQAPVAVSQATTDAEGKALFPQLATGKWTFTATKPGFGRASRQGVILRPEVEPPTVRLHMGRGHTLAGRVLSAAKEPVPGALVLAGPVTAQWDPSAAALRHRCETDAQGAWSFAGLEAGDTTLMVARPGGIPGVVATLRIPNVKEFDVVLKATGTVMGTVTEKEGGKKVEGATVRGWSWNTQSSTMAEGVTDAEGRFTMTVAEGSFGSLMIEKEGWVSADDPMRNVQTPIREGETVTRDLTVKPASKVSGVVRGEGAPLPGAKVWLHSGAPERGWQQKSTTTDAEGRYEFASAPSGKALVRADLAGWYVKDFPDQWWPLIQSSGPSPFKVDVPEGGAATMDLEMVRGVPVEGRVDGPDGPLAGVRVAGPLDWEGGAVTGADGAFRVDAVKPGPNVSLLCAKEGYAATGSTPFAVSADAPTTGIVLRMTRVGVVKGVVSASDGGPLADAQVRVIPERGGMGGPVYYAPSGGQTTAAPVAAAGGYEIPLEGVSAGKFRVMASALDRPSVTSDVQSIVEGKPDYVVNLTMESGRDLTGRVVARQGGEGVAGAYVILQPQVDRGLGGTMQGMEWGGGQSIYAIADAEGRFAVSHLASAKYMVMARADGWVQGSASVDLTAAQTVTVEIERELSIEGTVKFADGTPAEGLQITAAREQPGGGAGGNVPGGNSWAMTGPGGRFRMTGVIAGSYRLTVQPDWQGNVNAKMKTTDPIAAGTTDVRIVVEPGGVIAGRVLDPAKKGVPRIWIYANPEPKDGKQAEGVQGRGVQTREDGTFQLAGLSDVTTYALQVTAQQGWNMGVTLRNTTLKSVAVGTTNLEVVLDEGLTIAGTLVDGAGKPVPNAYMLCMPAKGGMQRNTTSDGAGAFTFAGLDEGEFNVMIQEMGATVGLVIQNGDKIAAGARDVRLVAAKGVTITGTIVDESGQSLRGVGVSATPKAGGRPRSAPVKDDGTFEVTGLSSDTTYKLTTWGQGRAQARLDDVLGGSAGIRLVIPKGYDAAGRVLDETGAPVKQGQLQFRLQGDPESRQWCQTDEDGNFKVQGLADGVYDVECFVRTASNKGYRKCGTVKAGETSAQLRVVP